MPGCAFFAFYVLIWLGSNNISNGKFVSENEKQEHEYGFWHSTLSVKKAVSTSSPWIEGPKIDPVSGRVFWVQTDEVDRNTIYGYNPDTKEIHQWTSKDYDVRTRVSERKDGAFLVYNDTLFFSNGDDNLLYKQENYNGEPVSITKNTFHVYADGCYSSKHSILFYVKEDIKRRNQFIVAVNLTSGDEFTIPTEGEYYASPILSPDDTLLAWIQWNKLNMPWDETRLLVSSLEPGKNSGYVKYIEHGSSIMPKFNKFNELFYLHDSSNWWNLYVINKRNFELNLTPFQKDVVDPIWRFGSTSYDISSEIGRNDVVISVGKIMYILNRDGKIRRKISTNFDVILNPKFSKNAQKIYMLAANWTESLSLVEHDLKLNSTKTILSMDDNPLPVEEISVPIFIKFPTTDNKTSFGFYYEPKNSNFTKLNSSVFPLIINIHDGPTCQAQKYLDLQIQYFTTRGFAFFDIDFRGSTGYGKKYRNSLYGSFGIKDRDDVISAAKYLIKNKQINSEKLFLRGTGTGGFTALSVLAFSDIFQGGTVYRGISNITKQIEDSKGSEKFYFLRLVTDLKNMNNFSDNVSPLIYASNISASIVFFHGLYDKLINVNQTILMHQKLLNEGIHSELHLLKDGEKFSKKSKSVCLEAEFKFYQKILKI
ncbi:UNVERIFIED_CONTAM: hypothetical protein RMT77_012347 [Armadillidium vulgare]